MKNENKNRGATKEMGRDFFSVAVAGNPNVGKSTLFNSLTGMRQHTGNWCGKTVGSASGYCSIRDTSFELIDIPGTHSLLALSPEEEVAKITLISEDIDATVVVCDATCLEKSLILALQIRDLGKPTLICVNLLDEARRKGIKVDLSLLEKRLGLPVVGAIARRRHGLDDLKKALYRLSTDSDFAHPAEKGEQGAEDYVKEAEELCRDVYFVDREKSDYTDRLLDALFVGKKTAYPIMFFLLLLIFWITIVGANYPSEILSYILLYPVEFFHQVLSRINCPIFLQGLIIDGAYVTLSRIVSVMLPPMAIFFPLFTLLEDSGYLPRVAFNLDKPFCKCKSCGKQALTMCMGFGCNAAGVVGCRIISSRRERMIAILTNSLVPCNGRFPLLIAILTLFFVGSGGIAASLASSLMLSSLIVLSIVATLLISRLLSATILKGTPSAFTLEMPPYRIPDFGKVIIRSIFDRTLFVLGRAVITAIPAGMILWLTANLNIGDVSLLSFVSNALDPLARVIGLDGVILIAFILAFPANEIVIPIIIMAYAQSGGIGNSIGLAEIKELFISNGWTEITALCTMIFSLFHWPCATTLLTVKKETGSVKWMIAAAIIPTLLGITICATINFVAMLFVC